MSHREGVDETVLARLQRAVLRHGLPGLAPEPTLEVDAITPTIVRHGAKWSAGQRLAGLWFDLLSQLEVDSSAIEGSAELLLGQLRTSLVCEATAVRTVEALSAAGIDAVLLKGGAATHLDYPDPAWRSSGDVDVLVPRVELHRAVDALRAVGFRRTEPPPRRAWELRFARAVMLRSEHDVEIDLHASIATGYFGTALDHDLLVNDPDRIDLGGVACAVLGGPARLVGSCYSAVLSRGANLRYLRDIAQQLLATEVDWQRTVDIARTGDGEAVLAAAVLEAVRVGVVPAAHPMAVWATTVSPTARARQALRYADAGTRAGWIADARSQLMALSFTDGLRFVAGAAFPPRPVRRARGLTIGRQFRRGLRFARLQR